MSPQFIVYGLTDPRTGEIRYIGKSTKGIRRAQMHRCPSVYACNPHKARWIGSLLDQDLIYGIVVLEAFDSGYPLAAAERKWIARGRVGGWPLTNIQAGGDGGDTWSGRKHTPETIEKMRQSQLGKKFTVEHRAKLSAVAKARVFSPETRRRLGVARSARLNSPEVRTKISAALTGKPRAYIAERNRTMEWTQEMRAKISAARALNKSNPPKAIYFEFEGERLSIAEWSRRKNINYAALRWRLIDAKWSVEKALST